MANEGASRRAILGGALAGAAVIGLGASRVSAAARPAAGGITATTLSSPNGCDTITWITGINRAGRIVGHGVVDGGAFGPVLWSGGRFSAPLAPGGLRPVEFAGISDQGRYAGTYDDADRRTAVVWTNGVPQPIRMGSLHTRAAAMDSSGRVLVQARATWPSESEGWTYDRMFLWDQGRTIPVLPPDAGPWQDFRVIALNNRGAVVATVVGADDPYTTLPFFWQAGRATWLTDAGGRGMDVSPMSLNDRGQVAGTAIPGTDPSSGVVRAFRWQAGVSRLSPLPPGVTSGGVWVDGTQAINMRGDVVARAHNDLGPDVPVLWSGDTMTALPVPDDTRFTMAYAINDLGDACGYYESAATGHNVPCLWRAGRRIDLPVPGTVLSAQAMRIDNQGHVFSATGPSGWGSTSGGTSTVSTGGTSTGGGTGGSVSTGGTSTGGGTGGSVSSGGTSTSGGTGGGTGGGVSSGGTTVSGSAVGGTTVGGSATGGITPNCVGTWYGAVKWTVPF